MDPFQFSIRNLRISYPVHGLPTKPVLDCNDLTIYGGKLYFLMGRNGSGKTSFLKALLGLLDTEVAPGNYLQMANGNAVHGREFVRQVRVGYIPQNPHDAIVPSMSVLENLVVRQQIATSGGIRDWLGRLVIDKKRRGNAEEMIGRFPVLGFLMDKFNHHAGSLSGGELQLLNLAAMLFFRPQLVLMDEPTSKLDDNNRTRFWQLLSALDLAGVAMVVVTHERLTTEVAAWGDGVHLEIRGGGISAVPAA